MNEEEMQVLFQMMIKMSEKVNRNKTKVKKTYS